MIWSSGRLRSWSSTATTTARWASTRTPARPTSRRPTASWRASTTRTSTRTRRPRRVQADRRGLRGPEGPGEARQVRPVRVGLEERAAHRGAAPGLGGRRVRLRRSGRRRRLRLRGHRPLGLQLLLRDAVRRRRTLRRRRRLPRAARDAPSRRRAAAAIRSRRSRSRSRRLAQGGKRQITLTDPSNGRSETLEVTIPKGLRPGQRIRLAGKGGRGALGGSPGDLLLQIDLEPHPHFRIEGDDLVGPVEVSPVDAALGGEAERRARSTARPRSSCRPARRRAGASGCAARACPRSGGERGDQYAEVKIVVPRDLERRAATAVRRAADARAPVTIRFGRHRERNRPWPT